MKIMFHLNCLEIGGAERVVSTLSNALVEIGEEIVIATEWVGEVEYELSPKVKRIVVGLTKEESLTGHLSRIRNRIRHLRRAVKEEKPDVVIAFAQMAIYRALAATQRTGTPVIAAVRTDPIGHYDSLADKILIPLLYRHAAGFVFQTTDQRDFFGKRVRDKSTIILNPVNDRFVNGRQVTRKEKSIVHSGRLVDFKHQKFLIEAFLEFHKTHPDYCLKIYGPDSGDGTKEQLEELIDQTHSKDYVFLMGNCENLYEELSKGTVFAFSSCYEGLPNALIEAMVLGLPIVATDCPCGGPKTLIRSGENGILVPVDHQKEYVEALSYLVENPDAAEKLGKEARKLLSLVEKNAIVQQWRDYATGIVAARR